MQPINQYKAALVALGHYQKKLGTSIFAVLSVLVLSARHDSSSSVMAAYMIKHETFLPENKCATMWPRHCHYCCHCRCIWHHQLERPIWSNFYLSPSRDAVDDQFQPTLFVLNGITVG